MNIQFNLRLKRLTTKRTRRNAITTSLGMQGMLLSRLWRSMTLTMMLMIYTQHLYSMENGFQRIQTKVMCRATQKDHKGQPSQSLSSSSGALSSQISYLNSFSPFSFIKWTSSWSEFSSPSWEPSSPCVSRALYFLGLWLLRNWTLIVSFGQGTLVFMILAMLLAFGCNNLWLTRDISWTKIPSPSLQSFCHSS